MFTESQWGLLRELAVHDDIIAACIKTRRCDDMTEAEMAMLMIQHLSTARASAHRMAARAIELADPRVAAIILQAGMVTKP